MELHRNDNSRMMQENVALIKEINDLRRELKGMKLAQRAKDLAGSGSGTSVGEPSNMAEAVQEIGARKVTLTLTLSLSLSLSLPLPLTLTLALPPGHLPRPPPEERGAAHPRRGGHGEIGGDMGRHGEI